MKVEKPTISFEEYEDRETFVEKYKRRIIQYPFLSAGLVGLGGMLFVGTQRYRKLRAQGMSVSVFLINLRVAAQGAVAAMLSIGVISHFINEQLQSQEKSPKKS